MKILYAFVLLLIAWTATMAQAPTISNIVVTPWGGGVFINWTTSAQATQRVFYDTVSRPGDTDGTQYASSTSNDTLADTSNQIRSIHYLTPNTTYFYKLRSANGGGTTFTSEASFVTTSGPIANPHLLIIRVNFPNDLASLPSDSSINTAMTGIESTLNAYAFSQINLDWTIVPGTITAPNDTNFYKALESTSTARRAEQLAIDVSAAAGGLGFDTSDYFQYIIWIPQLYDWANAGFFSGANGFSQMHLNSVGADYLILANLLNPSLGSEGRANGWVSNDSTVFGSAGAPDPSGIADPFDLLGNESPERNINIKHKSGMAVLLPANIPVVTTNGTYRIYAHDTETTVDPAKDYGLRMPSYTGQGTQTQYWVEFRQSNPTDSVLINWGGLLLLDMNPTSGGFTNAPLTSGTFTDPDGRTITIAGFGGTTPKFVDLTIGGLAAAPGVPAGMKGNGKLKGKGVIR